MEEITIDLGGRKRKVVAIECNNCGTHFHKRKDWARRNTKHYCSRKCSVNGSKQNVQYQCGFCKCTFISDKSRANGSKSGSIFCSRVCKDSAQRIDSQVISIRPAHYKDGRTRYRKRALRAYPNECAYCGYNEHVEILEVHHIDSNRKNGDLSNLIILCANHHVAVTYNIACIDDRKFHWLHQ